MIRSLWYRLRSLRRRKIYEADLDEEIRFHLDEEAEERRAAGLPGDDARAAAIRDFGNVTAVRETTRQLWSWESAEHLLQDVRDAWRSLRSAPIVSSVAIVSLGLGIGANTAVYSVLDALVFRALPVEASHRLALVGDASGRRTHWTNPIWEQLRDRSGLFDGAFAVSTTRFNLSLRGETEFVDGLWASGSTFDVLGVAPIAGRFFTWRDDQAGGGPDGPVAVISYRFWQQRFGGALDALGRPLTVERVRFTIVGVAPPEFFGVDVGRTFDVALPIGTITLTQGPRALERRSSWWLRIMVRLRPEQTLESGSALLRAQQPQIRAATLPDDLHPGELEKFLKEPLRLEPAAHGASGLRERYHRPLAIIMAAGGLVLLVACANLANLLLARASARRRELSVRIALGASRLRVVRLLLVESLLLASAGALIGLWIAHWGSRALVGQLSTESNPVFLSLALDWRVLAFTASVAVLTAALFGTAPALRASRMRSDQVLRGHTRGAIGDARFGPGQLLVVLQVALSLALVTGAGLFARTFAALARLDLGFEARSLLVARVDFPSERIARARRPELHQQLLDAAAAVPGVASAALSTETPLSTHWSNLIELPDGPMLPTADRLTHFNTVSPGWFGTYRTPLLAGRDFTDADRDGSAPVAIVNEAFARRFTAGGNPIGLRVRHPWNVVREVVGYVRDAAYNSIRTPVPPTLYVPYRQDAQPPASTSVTIRSAVQPVTALTKPLAAAISQVHPDVIVTVHPLGKRLDAAITQERIVAALSASFGTFALLLAALGVYGTTSFAVSRRRGELGVRVALGATPRGVLTLVLRRAAILVTMGIAAGVGVSLWAAQFVAPLLFDLDARDAVTLWMSACVLATVGLLAAWIPARRAARIDPAEVLRNS